MNYEVGASVARVRTYIMISLVASRWANHVSPVKLKQRGAKKTWNFHPFSAVVHLDQESMLVHVCTSNVEHFFVLALIDWREDGSGISHHLENWSKTTENMRPVSLFVRTAAVVKLSALLTTDRSSSHCWQQYSGSPGVVFKSVNED